MVLANAFAIACEDIEATGVLGGEKSGTGESSAEKDIGGEAVGIIPEIVSGGEN